MAWFLITESRLVRGREPVDFEPLVFSSVKTIGLVDDARKVPVYVLVPANLINFKVGQLCQQAAKAKSSVSFDVRQAWYDGSDWHLQSHSSRGGGGVHCVPAIPIFPVWTDSWIVALPTKCVWFALTYGCWKLYRESEFTDFDIPYATRFILTADFNWYAWIEWHKILNCDCFTVGSSQRNLCSNRIHCVGFFCRWESLGDAST